MRSPKSVLVLGHGGFIAGAVCGALRTRFPGAELHGLDRRRLARPGVRSWSGDLLDSRRLARLIRRIRPSWIFHLAGSPSLSDPAALMAAHVSTTASLFEAVSAAGGRPRILLPGSAAECGVVAPSRLPVRESDPASPATAYGFAKAAQSQLARVYAREGMRVCVARMFNILGPGLDAKLALSSFVEQTVLIERGTRPAVLKVGNLSAKRDFVDVSEAAEALILIAARGKPGETYNVCSGKSHSIRALVDELLSLAATKIRLKTERGRLRPVDLPDIRGSVRKTAAEIGWRSRKTPFDSLRDMLAARREER